MPPVTCLSATCKNLSQSLNPILGLAELTEFNRAHSPFVSWLIALCLWLFVQLTYKPGPWFALLTLLFFLTQESLLYNATLIRSEQYSILFWSLALLVLSLWQVSSRRRTRCIWLFLAGICLGISFITKLQALFHLLLVPLFFLLFQESKFRLVEQVDFAPGARFRRLFLGINLASLAVFGGLFWAAQNHTVDGVATFAEGFRCAKITYPFAFLLLTSPLAYLYLSKQKFSFPALNVLSLSTLLTAGFLSSFFLHFAAFLTPSTSVDYMLAAFKLLFIRETYYELDPISDLIPYLHALFHYNSMLFVFLAVSLAFTGLLPFKNDFLLNRKYLIPPAGFLFFILALFYGSRFMLHDLIYIELLINVAGLVLLVELAKENKFAKLHPILRLLPLVLITGQIVSNVGHAALMEQKVNGNFNHYGWHKERWLESVYPDTTQKHYDSVLQGKYENLPLSEASWRYASECKKTKQTIAFVFPNNEVTLQNVGVLETGHPVWTNDLQYLVKSLPPELESSLTVDVAAMRISSPHYFHPLWVNIHSDHLMKLNRWPAADRISVLLRRDLKIYLYVAENQTASLETPPFARFQSLEPRPDLDLQLTNKDQSQSMRAYQVMKYLEVYPDSLDRYFFVVKPD